MYIHTHLAYIPTPRTSIVPHVLYHLQYLEEQKAISLDDPIEKRLLVLIALFEYIEQPTADALKKQLELVREYYKTPH